MLSSCCYIDQCYGRLIDVPDIYVLSDSLFGGCPLAGEIDQCCDILINARYIDRCYGRLINVPVVGFWRMLRSCGQCSVYMSLLW